MSRAEHFASERMQYQDRAKVGQRLANLAHRYEGPTL